MKINDALTSPPVIKIPTAALIAEKNTNRLLEIDSETDTIGYITGQAVAKGGKSRKLKISPEDMADDTAALKLDNALSLALAGCGAKDADIVGKLLDRSIIKLGVDGKLIGVSEQLEKLKTDKAFLFGEDKPADKPANSTGMTVQLGARHDAPA